MRKVQKQIIEDLQNAPESFHAKNRIKYLTGTTDKPQGCAVGWLAWKYRAYVATGKVLHDDYSGEKLAKALNIRMSTLHDIENDLIAANYAVDKFSDIAALLKKIWRHSRRLDIDAEVETLGRPYYYSSMSLE